MARAQTQSLAIPSAGIFIAGFFWGLFWIPMRAFTTAGLPGAWPTLVVFGSCALILLPLVALRRRPLRIHWQPLLWTSVFAGASISLYATSLLLTDVARTILLFYMTPMWSTLIGLIWLGERLTLARGASLILGLLGLMIVFGLGAQFPWPENLGDWMALTAGLLWAIAMLGLFDTSSEVVIEHILAFCIGAAILTLAAIAILDLGPAPDISLSKVATFWPHALFAGCYLIPMFYLTIWPGTILSPARIGILLMGEVVVGTVSAAIWAGEPFGWRVAIGAVVIVSAALVEVLARPPQASKSRH